MNPRIVPQPPSNLATSEKPSAESHMHPNDDVVNVHKEIDQKVCSVDPMMERVSDLDTTNIYPHLDFNVRLWNFFYSTLLKVIIFSSRLTLTLCNTYILFTG